MLLKYVLKWVQNVSAHTKIGKDEGLVRCYLHWYLEFDMFYHLLCIHNYYIHESIFN